MILNQSLTDHYFFARARLASCRYILTGPLASERPDERIRNFFVRHLDTLGSYLDRHLWSITAQDVLQQIHLERRGETWLVDIPHYLVDAQRGLLCIDVALRGDEAFASSPALAADPPCPEPYTVLSIPVGGYSGSSQQTLTQSILAELTPWLPDGVRLAQNLESKKTLEVGLGNGFATVDLAAEQLQKLVKTEKILWKRFLERNAGLLRRLPNTGAEQRLPDVDRPLFTSVGPLPSAAIPLPNISDLVQQLIMFPCHIPLSRFAMTLYSFRSRLYFILSAGTNDREQEAITQHLLQTGWVIEARGE